MLPVFLKLNQQKCLVIGGGNVALHKTRMLLQHDAHVRVVSPEFVAGFLVSPCPNAERIQRQFQPEDLEWAPLIVIAATSDSTLQKKLFQLCRSQGIFINTVDVPANCDFYFGANLAEGPIQVAVSSSGSSPRLAQRIRDKIGSSVLSPKLGEFAGLLSQFRASIRASPKSYEDKMQFWDDILDSSLLKVMEKDPGLARAKLAQAVQSFVEVSS